MTISGLGSQSGVMCGNNELESQFSWIGNRKINIVSGENGGYWAVRSCQSATRFYTDHSVLRDSWRSWSGSAHCTRHYANSNAHRGDWLVIIMMGAARIYMKLQEPKAVAVNTLLLALSLFIAYYRW